MQILLPEVVSMRIKHHILYYTAALFFLLGIKDGYVALWKDNSVTPLEVFPYKAQLLPEEDQRLLEKGIYISSHEELMRLLEDYLS